MENLAGNTISLTVATPDTLMCLDPVQHRLRKTYEWEVLGGKLLPDQAQSWVLPLVRPGSQAALDGS